MAASGMLEALFALALHALVLASLLSGVTTLTLLAREAWAIHAESFAERQVEHLLDVATMRAGTGPAMPPALAAGSATAVVLDADLNGDATVDTTSAERTELELRTSAGSRVLFYQIGRQSMRIEESLPAAAQFRLFTASGGAAPTPAAATCIEVPRITGSVFTFLPARAP